jgi:phosphohistidine phosphatase SixA
MLTPGGRTKVEKVVSLCKASLALEVDRIVSSPYKRASETAEIAKAILKPRKTKITTSGSLAPENSPYEAYSFIVAQEFTAQDRVLVVSHQPLLGNIVSDLIGASAEIVFPPASMARIDIGDKEPTHGSGALVWFVSSDVV